MSSFDRNVLIDLLVTPTTLACEFVGVTMLAATLLADLGAIGFLLGAGSMLAGGGVAITRVLLDPDKVVEDTIEKKKLREKKLREKELDDINRELTNTKDWDVRKLFLELRGLHNQFHRIIPTLSEAFRYEMEEQFEELFDECLGILMKSHTGLIFARDMEVEQAKKTLRDRRAKNLALARTSINQITSFVVAITEAADAKDHEEINRKHESLKNNLEMMRSVYEDVREITDRTVVGE